MFTLNCSGLVTLSKHKLANQRYISLAYGSASQETSLSLYFNHFVNRKIMYADIEIRVSFLNVCTTFLLFNNF